jgi:ribonuclease P protein component
MLKKANRLAKAKDIQTAFERGRTFFNPFFTLKYRPAQNQKRFTVVVSTKVYKNAVSRNRLKRILREYLRKNLLKFKNGDYMIMTKPKIAKISEADVMKNFLDLLSKIK